MTSRQAPTELGSIPSAALIITLLSATSIENLLYAFITYRLQQRSRLVVVHRGSGRHRPTNTPVLLPLDLFPVLVDQTDLDRPLPKSEIDTRAGDQPSAIS